MLELTCRRVRAAVTLLFVPALAVLLAGCPNKGPSTNNRAPSAAPSLSLSSGETSATPSAGVADGRGGSLDSKIQPTPNTGPTTLTITSAGLAQGRVGVAYTATLAVTGGTAPYTWWLGAGPLPAGLSLNTSTGVVSGTPTARVSASELTFGVTDSSSPTQSTSVTLSLGIAPATLVLGSWVLPGGRAGVAYTATLGVKGGTAPYTWSLVAGTLPAGLSLNTSTGAVSGTASASVKGAALTFQVHDSGSPAQSAATTLSLNIAPATLVFTSGSLAAGRVGVAYTGTLGAMGGTGSYSWALAGGTLPAGLSLNTSTGLISGTPTARVPASEVTFKVTDSGSPAQNATVTLALSIAPATLTIGNAVLPVGRVGLAYTAILVAAGGTTPYGWSVVGGTLPAGLSLNTSTGAISGTPTAPVTGDAVTFQVSDSGTAAQKASVTLSLSVTTGTLAIMTASLPGGKVGAPYSATLVAAGGTLPYNWSLAAGALPAGLSLNASNGVISGTPRTSGSSSVTFMAVDHSIPTQSASTPFTLVIAPSAALTITTTSLTIGQVGVAYSSTLAATGGTQPYTWAVTSGSLPTGLALNASSGAITGTPTANVTGSAVTFKVADSSGPSLNNTVNLTVSVVPATLTVSSAGLPGGRVGATYTATLGARGGTAPYSWSLAGGTLPAGLSLNASTGVISGTPTAVVSASELTFAVSDAGSPTQTASATLSLNIAPATLVIGTWGLPEGRVGTAYTATLSARGGTAPYGWALAAGTLPAGLSFNNSTGVIGGTPTSGVSGSGLTFRVTDSGSPAQSASLTLSLSIAPATLVFTRAGVPGGRVAVPYTATIGVMGGTVPYAWSLAGGTLPAGLSLNASTGVISGTPTARVSASEVTFAVTDSGTPVQNATTTLTFSIAPPTLRITTAALPTGLVGGAYSATLGATGGTAPYSWSILGGSLPAGLSLNPSSGAITGTPTVSVTNYVTFQVSDSGSPAQTATLTLPLTATTSLTVSVSPARAALAVAQVLTVSATTNDSEGVTWSISPAGGSFNPTSSHGGANVTFTAPSTAGVYTVTATSVTDTGSSASFTLGVTDLAGVYTYHNDTARDGANTHEYALTTSNVNTTTFGKLFSCTVDGAVYAQPLWVASLTVSGAQHNVVFVATQHDSLYAFDADANPCNQLWQASLIDTKHGGTGGETTVPSGPTNNLVGQGFGDITPEVGVTGTPVIDPTTNTLYVVSKSVNSAHTTFYQRLHAIDITTGNEKTGSPVTIAATFPGTGDGGSTDAFNAQQENQRPGLALVNGTVYIAWSAHEDNPPWYGWVVGYTYNGSAFTRTAVLNVTPNVGLGGIWMGGGAPAADSNGHLYILTGNGQFDATNSSGPTNDYGDSLLQLSGSLGVLGYFTPSDEEDDYSNDNDFGSGGAAVVLNLTSGPLQHLVVGGGKDATLYLLNGDALGGFGDAKSLQTFSVQPGSDGTYATGAFWNNTFYIAPWGGHLHAFAFNPGTDQFNATATSSSSANWGFPGATPSVSASGASGNGIVWALNNGNYCTNQAPGCGPAVLHAYDATDLGNELWNNTTVSGDAAGNAVKFTVPTVANGHVYVGTRGNNTGGVYGSTTVSGELDVYGLKSN